MSRTEKLGQELDELEREFREVLIGELEVLCEGRFAFYLYNRAARHPEGRTYKRPETTHMERLEWKIRALREKLNVPVSYISMELVEEFVKHHNAAGMGWWHGEGKVVARALLQRARDEKDSGLGNE